MSGRAPKAGRGEGGGSSRRRIRVNKALCICLSTLALWAGAGVARAEGAPGPEAARRDKSLLLESRAAVRRAFKQLEMLQAEDGSWSADPAITGLVVSAILGSRQEGFGAQSETVRKGLAYIRGFAQPDGSIYDTFYPNYTTSICAMALVDAGLEGDQELIAKAQAFLLDLQADEGEGVGSEDAQYGGWGYEPDAQEGGMHRADMSNSQLAMEALHAMEEASRQQCPEEGEGEGQTRTELAYGKAIHYLEQCQSHDGGFIYRPGESKAGSRPDGGLRSYGSMTYAGLKSMIYARLSRDDPRVEAAHEWAQGHWSVTENPELGQQGLYYYYQTMAKALQALGEDVIVDAAGQPHDWRSELVGELLRVQRADGTWANENGRWMEQMPELATAYAVLAINHATQDW